MSCQYLSTPSITFTKLTPASANSHNKLAVSSSDFLKEFTLFADRANEENETNDEAAYRELFEETGISKNDIELDHFMDLNYFKYENNLQVYYGILKHDVNLVEEKNKLEWVELNQELLNNNKFGGNYNIPHIITQIKVFLKNGTGLGKY